MALTSYTGTSGNLINLNVPQNYSGAYFTVNATIPAGAYQMTIPSTVNSVFIGTKTFTASGLVNIPTTQTVVYGDIKHIPTIWTTRASGFGNNNTYRGAYGNGTFVVCRQSTPLSSSTDGITWTSRLTAASTIQTLAYGNGIFVAAIASPSTTAYWYSSTDGITWTTRSTAYSNSGAYPMGMTYGNGMFVGVGYLTQRSANFISRSFDGTNWTITDQSYQGIGAGSIYNIGYGDGSFIAVGSGGAMAASGNSITWTSRTSGTTSLLQCVAYGNGLWVAAGNQGTIITSPNGITWTARTSGFGAENIKEVDYINGMWYAVGSSQSMTQSTDGVTWTVSATPVFSTGGFNDIIYGKGKYILTNEGDNLAVSSYTVPSDVTVQLEYKGVGSVAV